MPRQNPSRRPTLDRLFARSRERQRKVIQLFDPPFNKGVFEPGYIKGMCRASARTVGNIPTPPLGCPSDRLQGGSDRAMELWNLINPIHHATTAEEVQRYRLEPYVVCADVYGAAPHTGRGGWTWYTGSASGSTALL